MPPSSVSSAADSSVELLARLDRLQPLLADNGVKGEQDRRVVEESLVALTDAGVFKIAQPRRYGGYEASVHTMLDVSAAVAEADGGTGWVVCLANVSTWMVGLFARQAQDDVWSADSNVKTCGVLGGQAESVPIDGGIRVTGRWPYASGSWHADWAVLGVPLPGDDGNTGDGVVGTSATGRGLVLVPRMDLDVEDNWFVAGMRSTGSVCLVGENVIVPTHRILPITPAITGNYRTEYQDEPLYRSAFAPTLPLALVGPLLGLGRKALALTKTKAAPKPVTNTRYATHADSVAFQMQLAEAAMMIDTAHLHAYRAADDIDSATHRGDYPDIVARARMRADIGWAVNHITKAIDLLMFANGASGFAETNPLQRIWRDSAIAARQASILPTSNFEIYGKALLGRRDQITDVI